MESLKPILLLIVLSFIGFAVYTALNKAPKSEPPLEAAPAWNEPVKIETGTPMSAANALPAAPAYPSMPKMPDLAETPHVEAARGEAPRGPYSAAGRSGDSYNADAARHPGTASAYGQGGGPYHVAAAGPADASDNRQNLEPMEPVTPTAGAAMPSGNMRSADTAVDPQAARQRHECEAAMRRANAAIQQNNLVEALRELSAWYDNPAVPPESKQSLDDLLSQLAGTVVYSREHWLEPAHVVQQGETLESIADSLQVPWPLLAKINGIDHPQALVVGEELKVVRGPFHAQLSRGRNELALFVNSLYAGRFDVQASPDVAQAEGALPVAKFAADHPSNTARQPYISLGGSLALRLDDGSPTPPPPGTLKIRENDLSDVFDILSDRSQVVIRR